jgi:hypothetical protein
MPTTWERGPGGEGHQPRPQFLYRPRDHRKALGKVAAPDLRRVTEIAHIYVGMPVEESNVARHIIRKRGGILGRDGEQVVVGPHPPIPLSHNVGWGAGG